MQVGLVQNIALSKHISIEACLQQIFYQFNYSVKKQELNQESSDR